MTNDEMERADRADASLDRGGEPPFDPPNLDDYSVDPADYAALERVFDKLALYCERKRRAMEHRASGDVDAAAHCEAAMRRVYAQLPEWAKW